MSSDAPQHLSIDFTITRMDLRVDLVRLEQLLDFASAKEGIQGEIGIWLCTDDEIADLHLKYMNVSGPTDVITFPGDAPDSGGYLGDIAVSIDTAAVQGSEAGHSVEREIAYLCLHGLLHIAGFDDLDEASRHLMLERQEELLSEFERKHPGGWAAEPSSQPDYDDTERG